jgi:endonuclease-8
MPEGHTLHRLARQHQRLFAKAPVEVSSPQGRFAAGASLVDGKVMVRAHAYGKHLFHVYGRDLNVHVHLGLIGTFSDGPLPPAAPVGQVRMRMVGGSRWTDLRGPSACEVLTHDEVLAITARLGADPLRKDADPDAAYARLHRSRLPIAVLLLDQSIVAGVGNVYRAELLFRHRVDPMREGRTIEPELWQDMWTDLVTLMRYGVRTGRIDTVLPEHSPRAMHRAPRVDRHGGQVYVYRRTGEPCFVCGTPIAMAELAGRNLYWCPVDQAP